MEIYRYLLEPPNNDGFEVTIKLPKGAQILTSKVKQGDTVPSIWAMVDPSQPLEDRLLLILPTGVKVPRHWTSLRYIDTIQIPSEGVVLCFHIFEQIGD